MFQGPNYSNSQSQTQPQPTPPPALTDTWKLATTNEVPPNGIHAGYEIDNTPTYVARVFHEGNYIPAKAIPLQEKAYFTYNGSEVFKIQFEYLTGNNLQWLKYTDTQLFPANAVICNPLNDQALCIGRAIYEGYLLCGKILRSQQILYVSFNNQEVSINPPYEILVRNN